MKHYVRRTEGAVAAEAVIWLALLAPVLFNIVDLGIYVFQRLQVRTAAQAAAQAAWAACPSPPTSGCANFTTLVTNAAQSTSLGNSVTLVGTSEGYRCRDVNTLAFAGSFSTTEPTCSNGGLPGYYVQLTVRFNYAPAIAGASLASMLAGNVDEVAWTRLR